MNDKIFSIFDSNPINTIENMCSIDFEDSLPLSNYYNQHMQPIFNGLDQDLCGGWVAGGFWRPFFNADSIIRDIDIFFPAKENALEFANKYLKNNDHSYHDLRLPTQAHLMHYFAFNAPTVQLIYRGFPTIETLLSDFDFTVAQFGTDGKSLFFPASSMIHMYKKLIIINKLRNPIGILKRINKYAAYGFKIPSSEYFKVVKELQKYTEDELRELSKEENYTNSKENLLKC